MVSDLPVLPQSVQDPQERFILVDLTDYSENTVSVAIDVVNVYVVAYRVGDRSYFLRDIPPEATTTLLFPGTKGNSLAYSGSYIDLQRAGNRRREEIYLGISELSTAVSDLWNDRSVPVALIVIIQMVSEAARFGYIERQVVRSIPDDIPDHFYPDALMLSMENNWSALSQQIQRANNLMFNTNITLRDPDYNSLIIGTVQNSIFTCFVALLLYDCQQPTGITNGIVIRMPGSVEEEHAPYSNNNNMCTIGDSTTRISGRDGLCVDVKNGQDNDGNPIQLWPCGQQSKQQWTFHTDGTIRSLGKCMTTYGYSAGSYVMIYDCDTAVPDATKWAFSTDGSITNPRSGLVLTAQSAAQGTTLTVETNIHAARQGWRGGDVEPTVTSIMGYKDMCMQANNDNTRVWLESCEKGKQQQQWAFYSDGTIRVNSSRNLCLTSDGHSSEDVIIILECQGWGDQRWVFKNDGSILNPNAKLVMDVKDSDVSLHLIILYAPNGNLNQQWIPLW